MSGRPEMLVKSVVATSGDVEAFGPLLANAAYERGFHAAARKAFVADGSSTNWGVWRKYFSHYTPILDFVHALMYVYAAAMAGRGANEGWSHYRDWAQWLWSGEVDRLLAALAATATGVGRSRKKGNGYAARPSRQFVGLPDQPTRANEIHRVPPNRACRSPAARSNPPIKQINRRIKGTEKFWSEGADPMLHLVADRLSQTNVTDKFWCRRLDRIIQSASYHQAA